MGGGHGWGLGSATPTCELHKHPAAALKLPSLIPGPHLALFVTGPTPCWPWAQFLFPLFLPFCHPEFWFQPTLG